MSLYTVRWANPFWPAGTYVERDLDGVQKCVVGQAEGRMTIDGKEGFVIPYSECEFCLMRVQKRGLDSGSVRHDRRSRMDKFVDQDREMEEESVQELCDTVHQRRLWPAKGGV